MTTNPRRLLLAGLALAAATPALAQEHAGKAAHKKGHSAAELNKQFGGASVDVQAFVKRFESDNREIAARREQIAATVGLKPGQAVADVGAGTGLFTWVFARQVGPAGKVYAVDVSEPFLKYIESQAGTRKLEGVVRVVRGGQDTTHLPAASLDAVFVCATYHHFEHPKRILASIHEALKPGGRLVIVDWDLRPDSSDDVRSKARATREVYAREIEDAGFRAVPTRFEPPMKENFVAVFERREATPVGP